MSASVSATASPKRCGSSSWLPTWKLKPAMRVPGRAPARPGAPPRRGPPRTCWRGRSWRAGCGTRGAPAPRCRRSQPANFASSAALSTTKVRTPAATASAISLGFLIGCVWMIRSATRRARQHRELLGGGDVEAAALVGEHRQHGIVRERLDRVVEAHEGQRIAQPPVLAADAIRFEQHQRGSVQGEGGARIRRRQESGCLGEAHVAQAGVARGSRRAAAAFMSRPLARGRGDAQPGAVGEGEGSGGHGVEDEVGDDLSGEHPPHRVGGRARRGTARRAGSSRLSSSSAGPNSATRSTPVCADGAASAVRWTSARPARRRWSTASTR